MSPTASSPGSHPQSLLATGRSTSPTEGGTEGDQDLPTIPVSDDVGILTNEESWQLSVKFAVMVSKLFPLMNRVLKVETLKLFLRSFRDVRTGVPYVDSTIYQNCSSTDKVLEALLEQHRFHSIQLSLLSTIVDNYGCDVSKNLLQEYKSIIPKSSPLKRLRNELTNEEIESSCAAKKLKVEIRGSSDTCTLEDVERTQVALEGCSGISRDAIVFGNHKEGSVILSFIVPESAVEAFTNCDRHSLANVGIMSIEVTIDGKPCIVTQLQKFECASEQLVSQLAKPQPLLQDDSDYGSVTSLEDDKDEPQSTSRDDSDYGSSAFPEACRDCIFEDPSRQELLAVQCFQPALHCEVPMVAVQWNIQTGRVEVSGDDHSQASFPGRPRMPIRPLPKRLLPGKRFVLCRYDPGLCRYGEQCTFAHSIKEQERWNEQLAHTECT